MLVRPELNSRPPAWQPGAQPTEPPVRSQPFDLHHPRTTAELHDRAGSRNSPTVWPCGSLNLVPRVLSYPSPRSERASLGTRLGLCWGCSDLLTEWFVLVEVKWSVCLWKFNRLTRTRLDSQPLFRERSQRSLPKSLLDAWDEPLLISANQKLACANRAGI